MKTIGIILILISLSATGAVIGENYLSMLKGIKRAESFLSTLLIGLENGRLSIYEMLDSAVSGGDKETIAFVGILSKNIVPGAETLNKKELYDSGFCKDKIAASAVLEAISILGKCSAEEQIEKIKYCRENIRKRYETSFEIYRQKAKLSRCSGVLAGLLAAVIFI